MIHLEHTKSYVITFIIKWVPCLEGIIHNLLGKNKTIKREPETTKTIPKVPSYNDDDFIFVSPTHFPPKSCE